MKQVTTMKIARTMEILTIAPKMILIVIHEKEWFQGMTSHRDRCTVISSQILVNALMKKGQETLANTSIEVMHLYVIKVPHALAVSVCTDIQI